MVEQISVFNVCNYFESLNKNKGMANCKICGKTIKCVGGSTSGMIRHLQGIHEINKNNYLDCDKKLSENNTLMGFVKSKTSLPNELLIKLICLDRISFATLVKSESMRVLFRKISFEIPKNATTINNIVKNEASAVRFKNRNEILQCIKEGKKFAISFDEYTGINNKKYLNLNVHLNSLQFWVIGLIEINGPGTGIRISALIDRKLHEYYILIKHHIVACVSDGAVVCKRIAGLLN